MLENYLHCISPNPRRVGYIIVCTLASRWAKHIYTNMWGDAMCIPLFFQVFSQASRVFTLQGRKNGRKDAVFKLESRKISKERRPCSLWSEKGIERARELVNFRNNSTEAQIILLTRLLQLESVTLYRVRSCS